MHQLVDAVSSTRLFNPWHLFYYEQPNDELMSHMLEAVEDFGLNNGCHNADKGHQELVVSPNHPSESPKLWMEKCLQSEHAY